MTDEARRTAVRAEMESARATLAEAELLLAGDRRPGAHNRAYYAAFHAARALLFSRGVEVRSHRALRSQLGLHFVKAGLLSAESSAVLARLEADRTAADYGRPLVGDRQQVARAVEDARRFMESAETLLRGEGWFEAGSGGA